MLEKWKKQFLARFGSREDLGKQRVYQQYWSRLPEQSVMELFQLLEVEFSLPPGLLRPQDDLDLLFESVETKNPFKWLVYRTRAEDGKSEVNSQLFKRMERDGTVGAWDRIKSVDDLLNAWCGLKPQRPNPDGVGA